MGKFRVLIGQHHKKCPHCREGRILAKGKDPKKAEPEDYQICSFCAGQGKVMYQARPMALVNPAVGAGNPTVPSSWQPSEVFEEDVDLDKMFNIPGSTKYERLPDDTQVGSSPMVVAPTPTVPMQSGNPMADFITRLEGMTLEQLKQAADAEEINVTGLKSKREIIDMIKSRFMPVGAGS